MARYSVLTALILALAAWVAYNTFKNAIIDAPRWNELAKKELSRVSTIIQPERGDLLAADGSVLATTLQYYTLRIDFGSEGFDWKGYVDEKDRLADSLALHFPIRGGVKAWQDSLDVVLRREKRPRGWRLINNISYADYLQIKQFPFFKTRSSGRSGLLAETMKRRSNPYGDMAKLSIGYVTESKDGEVHGLSGLERALDNVLFGKTGVAKQVNFTRGIGQWTEDPAERGWDVRTTIDVQMQDIVETALLNKLTESNAEWGTAVLMEVKTGEIKAMSNFEEDPKNPDRYVEAMNRAVRGFEPGSVVKTLSLMIAIEDGYVTDLDSVIEVGSSYYAFGHRPAITDSHHVGTTTVKGCIEQSSNIGVAKIMSRFYKSPQAYHDRVAALGILEPLHSGIWEERRAKFPVASSGPEVTLSRQFYGYGCELTPLHTLSIYNAIANDGVFVRPRLVKSLHREGRDSIVPIERVVPHFCSPKTAKMVRECLYEVVNGAHGTARSLKNSTVKLAGKTGTAYTVSKSSYDKTKKRLAFCGYFPADNPKYTCMVLIYHPRQNPSGAASTSGAVVRDVAMALYARGALGNVSDFREGAPEGPVSAPVVYASASSDLSESVERTIGTRAKRMAPESVQHGLPNVCGMGLGEAVKAIETAGCEVNFSGVGHVAAQNPAAGTPVKPGMTVTLTLKP